MMNIPTLLSAAVIVATSIQGATAAESKERARALPERCTLASMSAKDRADHLARLNALEAAAGKVSSSKTGFRFTVNLRQMPLAELKKWAKAEQGCCSFLTISVTGSEPGEMANVTVKCPAAMRAETLQAFGLKR